MPSAKVAAKKKSEDKAKSKLGVKKTVKTKKVSKKAEKKVVAKKVKKAKAPPGAKPKSAPKKKVNCQLKYLILLGIKIDLNSQTFFFRQHDLIRSLNLLVSLGDFWVFLDMSFRFWIFTKSLQIFNYLLLQVAKGGKKK